MSWPELLVLAASLALDASAISIVLGLQLERIRVKDLLLVYFYFGGSQGLMTVFGFGLGSALSTWIDGVRGLVSFLLLGALGVKMIVESRKDHHDADGSVPPQISSSWTMLGLAVATSVDALLAGVPLPLLGTDWKAAGAVVGGLTALMSCGALYFGAQIGTRAGTRVQALGGLVLIGLGLRAFLQS